MGEPVHFAPLENPSYAFRTVCGAWRDPASSTCDRASVTCRDCLGRLAPMPAEQDAKGAAAPVAAKRASG